MTEACPHCDHPTSHDRTYSDHWSWVYQCPACGNEWTTSRGRTTP